MSEIFPFNDKRSMEERERIKRTEELLNNGPSDPIMIIEEEEMEVELPAHVVYAEGEERLGPEDFEGVDLGSMPAELRREFVRLINTPEE